jgi:glycosyltransferase involved in cell wall biosynthesis
LKGAPLACRVISKINSRWSGKPWTRPQLVMRGFTEKGVNKEIRAIDGFKDAEAYVTCRPYTQKADEIAEDICGSSVILMPSVAEGFGLAAFEAIAAGVPAVMSSESGLGQLLLQGAISPSVSTIADAWVADVTGPDMDAITGDWVARIENILSDPQAAFSRGQRLREELQLVLSWENASRIFSEQIGDLLGGVGTSTSPAVGLRH